MERVHACPLGAVHRAIRGLSVADITIRETCSCGATFSASGSNYRSAAGGGTNGQHRSAEEMAERWRDDHKHEMPRRVRAVRISGGSRS